MGSPFFRSPLRAAGAGSLQLPISAAQLSHFGAEPSARASAGAGAPGGRSMAPWTRNGLEFRGTAWGREEWDEDRMAYSNYIICRIYIYIFIYI